jgi:hypothetical protein
MLRKLSKLTFFVQFLVFISVAALFWVPELINSKPPVRMHSEGPLYSFLAEILASHIYLASSLALLLVVGLSLMLYFIGSVNDILPRENFVPALFYLFLLSWNSQLLNMNPLLPAAVLIILSVYTLMKMYGQPEPYRQVFKASASIGLASLFYLPSMYFLIMIWISLVTYRIASWREWMIALIGFLIPFIYLISWYFWNDEFFIGIQKIVSSIDDPGITFKGVQQFEIAWMVVTFLLLSITLIAGVNLIQDKLISIRRKSFIMINFFIACMLMIFLSGSGFISVSQLIYLPLAFFMAACLNLLKRGLVMDLIIMAYLIFLGCTRLFVIL